MARLTWLVVGGMLLTGAACRRTPTEAQVVEAIRANLPPKLDGQPDDGVWKAAPEAVLFSAPRDDIGKRVTLKAVYDDERVYFLLSWADTNPDGKDCAELIFPVRGGFNRDPASPQNELWDVWGWQAQPNAAAGGNVTREVRRFTHPTTSEYHVATTKMEQPQERGAEPERGSGNICVVENHSSGRWVVELSGRLRANNAEEVAFDNSRSITMAVSVSSNLEGSLAQIAANSPELSLKESTTVGPITLRLLR